jgi:hypothetical protein
VQSLEGFFTIAMGDDSIKACLAASFNVIRLARNRSGCWLRHKVPRQQPLDIVDGMIGDALRHLAQIRLWKAVADLAIDGGGTITAGIRSRMQSLSSLEQSAVATFLKASQQPKFAREAEWSRLLPLELSLAIGSSLMPDASSA